MKKIKPLLFLLLFLGTTGASFAVTDAERTLDQEIQIGRALTARLIRRFGVVRDEALTRYVNLVLATVSRDAGRPELAFYAAVLDTEEVNAYAAPGGYILISRGALRLAKDESELAAILAHETAHVALFHNGKFESKTSWLSFFSSFLGAGGGVLSSAVKSATDRLEKELTEQGRSREVELEADRAAILFLVNAGYDTAAPIRYLDRMGTVEQKDILDRTHPSLDARIKAIQSFILEQGISARGRKNEKRFLENNPY